MFKRKLSLTQAIRRRDKIIELAVLLENVKNSIGIREFSVWAFIISHRSEILRSRKIFFVDLKRIIELHDELRGWVVLHLSVSNSNAKKYIEKLTRKFAKQYRLGYFMSDETFDKFYKSAVKEGYEKINYSSLLTKLRQKTKRLRPIERTVARDEVTGGIIFD